MPLPQGLQPVLKMKVDQLFLNWLSEPSIQEMLKDYLRKIKNGDELELGKSNSNLTENNNIASNFNVTERASTSFGAPCSPPSATLPSGSGSSNRTGPNCRALRRSVSVKKVNNNMFRFCAQTLHRSNFRAWWWTRRILCSCVLPQEAAEELAASDFRLCGRMGSSVKSFGL